MFVVVPDWRLILRSGLRTKRVLRLPVPQTAVALDFETRPLALQNPQRDGLILQRGLLEGTWRCEDVHKIQCEPLRWFCDVLDSSWSVSVARPGDWDQRVVDATIRNRRDIVWIPAMTGSDC